MAEVALERHRPKEMPPHDNRSVFFLLDSDSAHSFARHESRGKGAVIVAVDESKFDWPGVGPSCACAMASLDAADDVFEEAARLESNKQYKQALDNWAKAHPEFGRQARDDKELEQWLDELAKRFWKTAEVVYTPSSLNSEAINKTRRLDKETWEEAMATEDDDSLPGSGPVGTKHEVFCGCDISRDLIEAVFVLMHEADGGTKTDTVVTRFGIHAIEIPEERFD